MEKDKYSRGGNPRSIEALAKNRDKGLAIRREKARLKQIERDIAQAQKDKSVLNLELEIYKIKKRRELEKRLLVEMEDRQYHPLNKSQLHLVIKNVFYQ
jgi:hypothetical protein